MAKRFQMLDFRGSTQEKSSSYIFRFGYGKALNDKKVPDPVGSGVFVLQKTFGFGVVGLYLSSPGEMDRALSEMTKCEARDP
jgi:hypothetical protein